MKKVNIRNLFGALMFTMLFVSNANALPIVCDDVARNYMQIDDSLVNSCLGSGTGNISGNSANDAWLITASGTGYTLVSKDDGGTYPFIISTTGFSSGTWTIDASYWNSYNAAALGFKFGTGNTADEWFIFDLRVGETTGGWDFFATLAPGAGGLSHINLYATTPTTDLAEPLIVTLFGLTLLGLVFARRSMRS
jgi:hypothetical protein